MSHDRRNFSSINITTCRRKRAQQKFLWESFAQRNIKMILNNFLITRVEILFYLNQPT